MTSRKRWYIQDTQRSHIVDMTIADPPMEEIIADIYGQKRALFPETL